VTLLLFTQTPQTLPLLSTDFFRQKVFHHLVKEKIKDIEENFLTGYFAEYGGTYKKMKESFTTLLQTVIAWRMKSKD